MSSWFESRWSWITLQEWNYGTTRIAFLSYRPIISTFYAFRSLSGWSRTMGIFIQYRTSTLSATSNRPPKFLCRRLIRHGGISPSSTSVIFITSLLSLWRLHWNHSYITLKFIVDIITWYKHRYTISFYTLILFKIPRNSFFFGISSTWRR